jgi:hypothetical protein
MGANGGCDGSLRRATMHLPRFMHKRNTENVVAYRGCGGCLNKERMMRWLCRGSVVAALSKERMM